MNTPTPLSNDPILGKVIAGRYRVVGLIGDGGMCSVYRAEDRERQTPIALKVLPRDRAAEPDMAARFRREAMLGKRIAHPHVVGITDSGSLEDGSLYLAMELLEGRSLADLLEDGRLPARRAVDIAQQMLSALESAHALGIVHRDIKPGNVVLVKSGKKDHVKLIDFGIATNDRAAIKLTVAGTAFGTPEYISPEMAMGVPVDARADLYSVGVVLFQMVTGQLPFSAQDTKALLRAHVQEPPPQPRAVAPEAQLPAALEEIILRALAKLPEERFSSASAMRQALEGLALPQPTHRRHPWVWLGLVVAAGIAIAAVWWHRDRPPPTTPVQTPVQPAPKNKHHASPSPRRSAAQAKPDK
jgi:serine/threonine-protein kinase